MNLQCEPTQLSQNKILQAIETFSIGFIQLDFNWKIRYWNLAAEKLTGYKQAQLLNKNLFDVITEMNHIEFYRTWQNTLKNRKVLQFRDYFWPTQKWFEFYLYATEEDIIIHFQDITKKFATRKTLSKKINQLKEVSMFNSHAIRKPLANLIGLANLLDEDIKLSDFKEYVFYIRKSAKNLDEIISKINSIANNSTDNEHTYNLAHFHFKHLLEEIKVEITKESHKCQLSISCTDVLFYGNRQGIKFCLKTLILNAIKHSTVVHVIKISVTIKDSNLHVRVRDFGKGISKEMLTQIHATLISNKLTINRKDFSRISSLCIQHNGSFWINSDINQRTDCMMLLPLSNFSIFKSGDVKKRPEANSIREVNIHFNAVQQCLEVKWVGYFDSANVKKSFYKIHRAMKTYHCSKVISDETQAIGAGINSINWLVKDGFPLLYKAGLLHFAWITSRNEFSRLSAISVSKTLNRPLVIKIFPTRRPAVQWINAKK